MSSTPGWYPDPAGVSGRFRHWDGRSWSAETSTDPTRPAPSGAGGGAPPERPPRRRGLLIGIVAGALVLVLAAVFGIRALLEDDGSVTGPPPPSSSVSGWDETSGPDPTPTPSPTPSTPPASVECPEGDPAARTDHPADDRVHGGGLSFPRVDGWEENQAAGLSWAYDVDALTDDVEPGWFSMLAVGALRMADGFEQAQESAEMISQCVATSSYYAEISGVTQLESAEITVDGKPGWRVRTEVRVDDPTMESAGDVVDVIVVDTGGGESLGMFLGAVPIADEKRLSLIADTEAALTVE